MKKSVKTIGTIATIVIMSVCSYMAGTTQMISAYRLMMYAVGTMISTTIFVLNSETLENS